MSGTQTQNILASGKHGTTPRGSKIVILIRCCMTPVSATCSFTLRIDKRYLEPVGGWKGDRGVTRGKCESISLSLSLSLSLSHTHTHTHTHSESRASPLVFNLGPSRDIATLHRGSSVGGWECSLRFTAKSHTLNSFFSLSIHLFLPLLILHLQKKRSYPIHRVFFFLNHSPIL